MGKVYFYALDLARISASQALLMGKVPTTKLDLARSGPTKWNPGSLPENASRSGGQSIQRGVVFRKVCPGDIPEGRSVGAAREGRARRAVYRGTAAARWQERRL